MNNNYPNFPNNGMIDNQSTMPPNQNVPNFKPGSTPTVYSVTEPPYAENILTMNVGKYGEFYMSYGDSTEWKDRIFRGIIQDAGRDYILIKERQTNKFILLWTVYLDYVIFDEMINH